MSSEKEENRRLLEIIRSFDQRLQVIEKMLKLDSGQQTIYKSQKVADGTSLGGEEYVRGASGERQHIERVTFCKCGEKIEENPVKCGSCGHFLHRWCSVWEGGKAFCTDCKEPPLSRRDYTILWEFCVGHDSLSEISDVTGLNKKALKSRLREFRDKGWFASRNKLTEQGHELFERTDHYWSTYGKQGERNEKVVVENG